MNGAQQMMLWLCLIVVGGGLLFTLLILSPVLFGRRPSPDKPKEPEETNDADW